MLEIKDLHASVDGKDILKGISLSVRKGEIHAIMGPNGSGKSTLAYVLAGRPGYEITAGSISFNGADIAEMDADERARAGLFLGFQYPVEVPGVPGMNFLRTAVNAVRKERGQVELNGVDFLKMIREKAKLLNVDDAMLKRAVNVGFSGGEKKRNEIIQMLALEPRLAVLDETDSGLDIDALKVVSDGINAYHSEATAVVLVTHYQRLLSYVIPDHVHVLAQGKIIKSGGRALAEELETTGYGGLLAKNSTKSGDDLEAA